MNHDDDPVVILDIHLQGCRGPEPQAGIKISIESSSRSWRTHSGDALGRLPVNITLTPEARFVTLCLTFRFATATYLWSFALGGARARLDLSQRAAHGPAQVATRGRRQRTAGWN
jgi:hypothetical protein